MIDETRLVIKKEKITLIEVMVIITITCIVAGLVYMFDDNFHDSRRQSK